MKLLFKLFALIFVLALVGVGIFIWMFDINSYRADIEAKLSAALNRPVTIQRIEMKISMIPTVKITDITIGNPTGFSDKTPFVKVGSAEGTLALGPLIIDKKVQIVSISLQKAEVNVVNTPKQNNLTFGTESNGKKSTDTAMGSSANVLASNPYLSNMRVDSIDMKEVLISYQDKEKTHKLTLNNLSLKALRMLTLDMNYDAKPIQLSINADWLSLIKGTNNIVFNGELKIFDISSKIFGSIGNIQQLKDVVISVDAQMPQLQETLKQLGVNTNVPASTAKVSGFIKGDTENVNLDNVKIVLDDVVELKVKGGLQNIQTNISGNALGTLTLPKSALAEKLGLQPMNVSFSATLKDSVLAVEKLTLTANRSDIDAIFSLKKNKENIAINGRVVSNYLDKNDFLTPADTTAQKPATNTNAVAQQGTTVSNQQPKSDILSLLTGQIDWQLANVKLIPDADEYYGITGRTAFNNGVITANPLQIRTIAGTLNTAVQVKNALSVPQIQVTASAENLNLDNLKFLTEYVSGSTANLMANLAFVGTDTTQILSTLTGTAEVEVTQGKIVNKWFNALPETVGLFQKAKSFSYSQTDAESTLNCGVINVKANNGILTMKDSVAVETSTLNLLLSGTVDLPQQSMNVSLIPELPNSSYNNALQMTQIIKLTGSFTAPKVSLDAREVVQNTVAQATDKAINKLIDKANEKGVGDLLTAVGVTNENTQVTQPTYTSMCERALGRKLKGRVYAEPVRQQTPKAEEVVQPAQPKKLTTQDELKNQLIKSISILAQ